MKSVFLLSLMSLSTMAYADAQWKVIAETSTDCKEKVQVLAKEGEKFVYVAEGGNKTKLFAEDGSTFSTQNGSAVVYSNIKDKSNKNASKSFTFSQPSMVDGNPPKIDIATNGLSAKCKMTQK